MPGHEVVVVAVCQDQLVEPVPDAVADGPGRPEVQGRARHRGELAGGQQRVVQRQVPAGSPSATLRTAPARSGTWTVCRIAPYVRTSTAQPASFVSRKASTLRPSASVRTAGPRAGPSRRRPD